jgi:hypothetical protein
MAAWSANLVTPTVFEIQVKRAYGGWQWVFRTYDIPPRGDPVFEFARCGDLDGLRQVLSSGKVSLFVRDELGMTLLSVSGLLSYPFTGDF